MEQGSTQWLIDILIGIVLAGFAWWNTTMWGEIKDTRRRLHDQSNEINKLNVLVVGNYITRPEVERHMHTMTETLLKGFDKIDAKMDDIYDELKQKADKPS